ncbi:MULTISPECIES: MFS transporter [unclassified Streptomyces]|uniref:MFS transporter n=1 Tax=unclassified Streptomyces TaxID=2593676 RepID=UPI00068A94E3|nr:MULTISPECIES: MFS transporter [unclassified Streptomyces]
MASTTMPTTEQPARGGSQSHWLLLFVLLGANFMDLLDGSVINVAMPAIRADLGGSYTALQWMAAGYALAFAVLLVTGGRLGDIFGRRRTFLAGLAAFTAMSALCAVAQSPTELIAARVLQGAAAAVMVPQVLAIIKNVFPPEQRAAAFGASGPFMGLAAVGGPVLGGALVDWDLFGTGWRSVFLLNVPVGVVAFAIALRILPESRSPRRASLDIVGMLLATTGLFLLVYPLVQGREQGWPGWILAMLAGSVPVLALFAWYEIRLQRADRTPLVEMSLLRNRTFVVGLFITLAFFCAMAGYLMVLALHLQIGLGFSALKAGLTEMPWAVGVAFGSAWSGMALVPRYGGRVLKWGLFALLIGTAGTWLTLQLAGNGLNPWELIPSGLLCGTGMGFVLTPLTSQILGGVSDREVGSASGLLNAFDQLGGTLGVAVLGTVFVALLGGQADHAADTSVPRLRAVATASGQDVEPLLTDFRACVRERVATDEGPSSAGNCSRLTGRGGETAAVAGREVEKAARTAFTDSTKTITWFSGGLILLALLLAGLLPTAIRDEDWRTEEEILAEQAAEQAKDGGAAKIAERAKDAETPDNAETSA